MPPAPLIIPERDVPGGRIAGVSPTESSPTSPMSPTENDLKSPTHKPGEISPEDAAQIEKDLTENRKSAMMMKRMATGELPETSAGRKYKRLARFVRSDSFETWVGLGILVNCLTLGVEVNGMVEEQAPWVLVFTAFCEHFFTLLFLVEFTLKVIFVGWVVYVPCASRTELQMEACWNLLDAFFVWVTGVFVVWIAPLASLDVSQLRIFTAVRAIRLLRLVRVVRKMPQFSEAYLLIRGLSDSMRTLFWTVLVIFFITYIFAIFGIVIYSVTIKEAYEDALQGKYSGQSSMADLEMLWDATGGVDRMMYTLIQVLTLDSWTGISRPMEYVCPGCWLYFFLYIILAAIVFLNLVTAVIVENALENSKADEDAQLMLKEELNKKLFKTFQQLFLQMDDDDDGTLTADEFDVAFNTPDVARKLKLLNFKREECVELFHLLDEGDGCLTLEEFFYGLQQMKGEASAKEVYVLSKIVERIWHFLLQFAQEADQDSTALFDALGVEKPPDREGSVYKRSQEATKLEMARKDPDSPLYISPRHIVSPRQQKQADLQLQSLSFPQMTTQIQGLLSYFDGISKNLNAQMDSMSTRLAVVEENSASSHTLMHQLLAPTSSEPKLQASAGQSLGRCCAM